MSSYLVLRLSYADTICSHLTHQKCTDAAIRPPASKGDSSRKKADSDLYHLFSAEHMNNLDNIQAMDGGFFLLAILLGGDYAKGLQGCGPMTACALSQTDLGESLLTAAKTMVGIALDDFLVMWRDKLRSEFLHPSVTGASKHPALADKIPADFPNIQVLNIMLYWKCRGQEGARLLIVAGWRPPLPDITCIDIAGSADFCNTRCLSLQCFRQLTGQLLCTIYSEEYWIAWKVHSSYSDTLDWWPGNAQQSQLAIRRPQDEHQGSCHHSSQHSSHYGPEIPWA